MNGIKKSIHIKGDLEYLLFRVASELEDNPNELENNQLDHFPEGSNEERYSIVGPVVVEVEEKPKMMKLYIRGPIKSYAERKNALKRFQRRKNTFLAVNTEEREFIATPPLPYLEES